MADLDGILWASGLVGPSTRTHFGTWAFIGAPPPPPTPPFFFIKGKRKGHRHLNAADVSALAMMPAGAQIL